VIRVPISDHYFTPPSFNPATGVEVPGTFQALCGLPYVFRDGPVLIREEYLRAVDAIQDYQDKGNAVVVVGHPGIGTILPISDYIGRTHRKAELPRQDHFLILPVGSPLVESTTNYFPVRRQVRRFLQSEWGITAVIGVFAARISQFEHMGFR
jgi:hypothetical protein